MIGLSNSAGRRRAISYASGLSLAAFALYAYTLVPRTGGLSNTIESIFLLNAALGTVVVVLYSAVSRFGMFRAISNNTFHLDLRFPVGVATLCLAAAIFYGYEVFRSSYVLVPLPGILVFAALSFAGIYPFRGNVKAPTIRPLDEDWVTHFVSQRPRLKSIAESRAEKVSLLLDKSGVIGNPYIIAARGVTWGLLTAAIMLPLALPLGLFVSPVFLLLCFAPVGSFFYFELKLRDKASERRDGVERELPFFMILVNVLGSAGVHLYDIFDGVIEARLFSHIRSEALLIRRDVEVFGKNPIESFERLASTHPSRKFSAFLHGYSAKVRSGGDIPTYLLGESGNLLKMLETDWKRYAERAGTVGSMMITIFVLVPMLMLVVALFSPLTSVFYLTTFIIIGIPLFTVAIVFMVGRMQPVGEDPLFGNARRSLLLSLPASLVMFFVIRQAWLALASALFMFCTVYGYSVLEQRREVREVDEALPEFIKDLMEFKRQEYDVNRALIAIASQNRYTPTFDRILAKIGTSLRLGIPLNKVEVDVKSRLARMVFFIVGEMSYSGGGTVDTLFQLSAYTSTVQDMKRNTIAEMRPYLLLAYLSPIVLVIGVSFTTSILSTFSTTVSPGLTHLPGIIGKVGQIPPQLTQVVNALVIASSTALGVIAAKIVDFTVKNTLRVTVNVALASIAAYALSQVNLLSLFHAI